MSRQDEMMPRVEKVDDLDREILFLKFRNRSLSLAKIGKLLTKPMTAQAVKKRVDKPEVQAIFQEMEKDIITQIEELRAEALVVYKNALRGKDQRLAVQVARDILGATFENAGTPKTVDELPFEEPDCMKDDGEIEETHKTDSGVE